jgi:hypothetical protein
MKVSGFTFIRNAVKFDYPVLEAIRSVLPLCDEFIVLCGNSDDETDSLISRIASDKIRIHRSIWDDTLRKGGRVLADETNKAKEKISPDADWCFYIQADEVLHEKYQEKIRESMLRWKDDIRVEGLLFDYTHFYGSYDFVGDSVKWYRKEVRIVRNDPAIRSFRDAQGFQKNGRPLQVKHSGATIYHYGWVKPPVLQQEKQKYFHRLWHNDDWMKKHIGSQDEFDYAGIDSLAHFRGIHPEVMRDRIAQKNWKFDFDPSMKKLSIKSRFKMGLERLTGWRIGEYRNYKLI